MRPLISLVAAGAAAVLLCACTEPTQDPVRSYAGKEDAKAYSGDAFKGDKAKWEASLSARAEAQNDYGSYRVSLRK